MHAGCCHLPASVPLPESAALAAHLVLYVDITFVLLGQQNHHVLTPKYSSQVQWRATLVVDNTQCLDAP